MISIEIDADLTCRGGNQECSFRMVCWCSSDESQRLQSFRRADAFANAPRTDKQFGVYPAAQCPVFFGRQREILNSCFRALSDIPAVTIDQAANGFGALVRSFPCLLRESLDK